MPKSMPKLTKWILEKFLIQYNQVPALGDLEEEFEFFTRKSGLKYARRWYRWQVFKSIPSLMNHMIYWSHAMFKNYFKVALRNIRRNKWHSFINIAGLSIGMTCVLFIMLFVQFERSYDNYHKDPESIYRVAMEFKTRTTESLKAMTYSPMRKVFKDNFPSVAYAARVRLGRDPLVTLDDRAFYEIHQMWTDTDLFGIFSIRFLHGNPRTALDRPKTVVVTRNISEKYFDRTDVIGKTIEIDGEDYEITGVVEDSPKNTHLKYELIHSFKDFEEYRWTRSWTANMVYNYIKLRPSADRKTFEDRIRKISDRYIGERDRELGYSHTYFLQQIKDIHLYSHLNEEMEPPGNPLYLMICTAVGVLVLLIACLNFINLSTALSVNRAKEVGMRKVVGAFRRQLITQFLGDALIFSFLALCLSMFLANLLLPYFNLMAGMHSSFSAIFRPKNLSILGGLTVLVGLTAGTYPAFFLSGFKPLSTLKGILSSGARGRLLRRVLVGGQFTISIILVICTLLVYRQLDFMKQKKLGFQPEQKLVIPIRGGVSIQDNYETIKHELGQHPNVLGATASSYIMGGNFDTQYIYRVHEMDDRRQVVNHLYVDADYIPLFGIEMEAGRSFQRSMSTDADDAVIINESAARALGFPSPEDAVGKIVESGPDGNTRSIIGVTRDFHYRGVASEIEPLVMKIYPRRFYHITLLIKTEDLHKTLSFVDQKLKELFPDHPLEHFFLDTFFNAQYRKEEQIGRLFGTLSALGLFIASLGLLGLISYTVVQRKKEIGIRKVLGSPVTGIVLLLTREFTRLVLLANVIAWPVAYYLGHIWLIQFPYRTSIGYELFIMSALLVLAIALLSVSYQAVKAATADPVESLKYE